MTEKLYDRDSHIKEFQASVLSCEKRDGHFAVRLDKTAFFPEGGGQSSDRGTIGDVKVFDVRIENGEIYHYTEKELTEGEAYTCSLDWKLRFRNMQNHSGEHIISGIVHKLYGYDNVGFHLGDEMTVDFDGELTREQLLNVERLANEAVFKNAEFTAYYPSADELEGMEYRSKLDLHDNVRIVTIKGYDVCACCAPHVKSAAEIGIIKILDSTRLRGGVRLIVKCGTDALCDYNTKYENVYKISNLLSVKQNDVADAAEKFSEQINELKYQNSCLKKRLITRLADCFCPEFPVTASFEESLDIKELQQFADALYKKSGGIRAVFSGCEGALFFAICGQEKALERFFAEFKKELTVKGGGRNGMVSGTLCAGKAETQAFFDKNKAFI